VAVREALEAYLKRICTSQRHTLRAIEAVREALEAYLKSGSGG
jgi:hypothetical protein